MRSILCFLSALSLPCLVPGTPLTPELQRLINTFPDKKDVIPTTSRKFKEDIARHCRICHQQTVLEMGCYHGYGTAVLSRLFKRVLVVDYSKENLAKNKARNQNRSNVIFFRQDLYEGSQPVYWASALMQNDIDVVVIDALHEFNDVASDIDGALSFPRVKTLIFDDYGACTGVRRAVDMFTRAGILKCFGIGMDWFDLSRDVWDAPMDKEDKEGKLPEGLICQVFRRGPWLWGQISEGGRHVWDVRLEGVPFACYKLFAITGFVLPDFDFEFHVRAGQIRFLWKDQLHKELRLPYNVSQFRIHLPSSRHLPGREMIFSPRLRSCFFYDERDIPRYSCRAGQDMTGLIKSAIEFEE
mmetsp:Transcript_36475/g.79832  ORF Transcript_36475/g.79832 Transcript_36475/m.79832 type:complete len:356 (-) Transcript_36475:113-1180(-)